MTSRRTALKVVAALAAAAAALAYTLIGRTADAPDGLEPGEWFVDRAAESGLDFVHTNGMAGGMFFPEIMGPGAGLIDYDNDGDLDVYFPQGRPLGTDAGNSAAKGRLFRNELSGKSDQRLLRFTDVTEASGIAATGFGMGVVAGDYNNDGCADLYLTNFGSNQLYRNNCNGTFTDVTRASGTEDPGWSVSAAFLDYDRDGWLDLFVGHYVHYSIAGNIPCYTVVGTPDYCAPHVYSPQPSHLFRNNRNGTFTDVTAAAGMAREFGPTLGAVAADFNGDGWPDLYVANDLQANQLWINQRDGTFRNTALVAGVALSGEGMAKSSMGVDAGDFDNDGDEDLFITELTGQGSDLYVNDGSAVFVDRSAASRLRILSLPYTGFGAAWLDFDNDGWLDVLTVNGTVTKPHGEGSEDREFPFAQRKQLFRNRGTGDFEDVTASAGAVFERASVGRGAAFGDLDNDGDADVLVANTNGRAELLINQVGTRNHWIGLRLVGAGIRRDALGARVEVAVGDARRLRRARSDGSYASASDPRVLVGLGRVTSVSRVRVSWPGGRTEEWRNAPINAYTTLQEGTGEAVSGGPGN